MEGLQLVMPFASPMLAPRPSILAQGFNALSMAGSGLLPQGQTSVSIDSQSSTLKKKQLDNCNAFKSLTLDNMGYYSGVMESNQAITTNEAGRLKLGLPDSYRQKSVVSSVTKLVLLMTGMFDEQASATHLALSDFIVLGRDRLHLGALWNTIGQVFDHVFGTKLTGRKNFYHDLFASTISALDPWEELDEIDGAYLQLLLQNLLLKFSYLVRSETFFLLPTEVKITQMKALFSLTDLAPTFVTKYQQWKFARGSSAVTQSNIGGNTKRTLVRDGQTRELPDKKTKLSDKPGKGMGVSKNASIIVLNMR
jgi:hypothetical protein